MVGILPGEFSPFEEGADDELYLWCLVQLSRAGEQYVRRYWPDVLQLDANFRAGVRVRPPDTHLIDRPYRLTDLLLYYFALYTRNDRHRPRPGATAGVLLRSLFPD